MEGDFFTIKIIQIGLYKLNGSILLNIMFHGLIGRFQLKLFIDVIASIKSMENMECIYEKVSRNVT